MNENNNSYLEKLTNHRRNLHMIPEIDRDLPETKAYLLSVLENLDCQLTFLCGSGICAFFDFGQDHAVAFRSDMDALPVTEEVITDHTSKHPGFMHACGHDGHMSMVLTLAEYLGTLEDCKHNVLLIFQPAEETLGGAEEICESGILAQHNVKAVFGIHLWPFLEPGVIGSRPGALMPRSAEINIDFVGEAAHGTSPYEGLDVLYIASEYVQNVYKEHAKRPGAVPRFAEGVGDLEYIKSETPDERTVIHIGKMTSGYARNIVSDYTHLLGTIRGYDDDTFGEIVDLLTSQLQIVQDKYGCKTEFSRSEGYPPVINQRNLYAKIEPILEALDGGYEPMGMPLMISEDFSFYGHYAPAVFFLLGTGTGISLHSTNFDFDESILLGGFQLYKSLLQHTDFTEQCYYQLVMLGYVKIDKGELKVREYDAYTGYYCGVCKSIGKRYGQLPRMVLSYDAAFLGVLLAALDDTPDNLEWEHCIAHHIQRKPIIRNDAVDYAADVMLILAWYKLADDVNDEHKVSAKLAMKAFGNVHRKLQTTYPVLCDQIESLLQELTRLENEKCDSLDMVADSFAKIMEIIFKTGVTRLYGVNAPMEDTAGRIGYHIGKWIYLVDAIDDIDENLESGAYNPLFYRFKYDSDNEDAQSFKERIKDSLSFNLYQYLAVISQLIDDMNFKKHIGIIDNIIYFGLNHQTRLMIDGPNATTGNGPNKVKEGEDDESI